MTSPRFWCRSGVVGLEPRCEAHRLDRLKTPFAGPRVTLCVHRLRSARSSRDSEEIRGMLGSKAMPKVGMVLGIAIIGGAGVGGVAPALATSPPAGAPGAR